MANKNHSTNSALFSNTKKRKHINVAVSPVKRQKRDGSAENGRVSCSL